MNRIEGLTPANHVALINKTALENIHEISNLTDFSVSTIHQSDALRYIATRACEMSIKSNADIASAFVPNTTHTPARALEITQSLNRFVETLRHAGEIYSQGTIKFLVLQFHEDLEKVKERLFLPLTEFEQNFEGLQTQVYENMSLFLGPESLQTLTKILGFFMVNPAITTIFFSPIIMVFVKALGFKRQLLFSFVVQPDFFKMVIQRLYQTATAVRTGLVPLAPFLIARKFVYAHRHSIVTMTSLIGFTSFLLKTSKIKFTLIQFFKSFKLKL